MQKTNAVASDETNQIGAEIMAGIAGRSGPPGNTNAFKHGLAGLQDQRQNGAVTVQGDTVRAQILDGLIADKGGPDHVSTAMRVLAEIVASDAAFLMEFNRAIDSVIAGNPKARQNPRGLAQLDSYKRPLVNSLAGNIAKFGLDRVPPGEKDLNDVLADIRREQQAEAESKPDNEQNGKSEDSEI